jgi:predicted glycosyltransferase
MCRVRAAGESLKVWYDACTGKHVRYGTAAVRRLRKRGHEVVFTTREHPDTLALAKLLGEAPIVIGKYNPQSLLTRLEESANRLLQFSKLFRDKVPDVAISSQSPDLCRFAFGLKIRNVLTADTPYAEAVNRLTIPLADELVTSSGNPQRVFNRYGARRIVQFDGVDEVAWILDFTPSRAFDLGRPLIVVRQMETRAAYALGKMNTTERLAQKLTSLGKVVFLPRYSTQKQKGMIIMKGFVDTAELVSNADLVVGVGGTISREAALQGVPSIAVSDLGRIYVNEFLAQKGFPLFTLRASEVMDKARECLGKRWNVKKKLASLENPVDVIINIIESKNQPLRTQNTKESNRQQ